ncbi:Ndufa10p [Halocaridina rubra]|uniref:NADH dehydrogenase [ubiquinone] 1 alpha subcomplex subunit 10, mitochondrial n=1 Tax=Halocaridina rubra TaxID=373956 RepID=A0AAN8XDG2_HALRR
MALSAVRKGVSSLTGRAAFALAVASPPVVRLPVATIVSKAFRPRDYQRPSPYPYKENSYGFFQALVDKTTHRIDENSKIIVVDGPFAVGKSKFAKEIAEDLDMLYIPEANMDMYYINDYGYDMRQLDPQMPDSCKSFDEKDFLKNPKHPNVAGFQFSLFRIRLEQYIDALAHVLSTGQGVVLDRSVYSDFVFAETLASCGYLSRKALKLYYEVRKMTVPELMRPHLVIYLDCPVDVCLQKIKKRNLPHEVNSPVYTPEYLTNMETIYKQQYLKQMSNHARILVYDWSEEGDAEVVVEDIERVNFELDKHDPLFDDWKLEDEWSWCGKRIAYTKNKNYIMLWMNVPDTSVKELVVSAEDEIRFNRVWYSAPGMKYETGFNANMGDAFLLTKTKKEVRT